MKTIKLQPNKFLLSYDAEALFPSIPLTDAIELIYNKLLNDNTLPDHAKLLPQDLKDLLNLCLPSSSGFVYDSRHHTVTESGPIGLNLMVIIAEIWMDHTIRSAVSLARQRNIPYPRNIEVYMDDSFGIMTQNYNKDAHILFNGCLNDVHPCLKFTYELEENRQLPFLDCLLMRDDQGNIKTTIYRKPSNTGVTIKANSCQGPTAWVGAFKGALCRAHRICSDPDLRKKETEYLLNNYEDNGFDKKKLIEIATSYKPPTTEENPPGQVGGPIPPPAPPLLIATPPPALPPPLPMAPPPPSPRRLRQTPWRVQHQQQQSQQSQQQSQQQPGPNSQQQSPQQQTQPQSQQQSQQNRRRAFTSMPYIPSLANQLQRIFRKNDCKLFFRSGPKLTNILCSGNKTQPPKLDKKGIYKLSCSCSPNASYVGETRVSIKTRVKQHKDGINTYDPDDSNAANQNVSGITRHASQCINGVIKWEEPEILATFQEKNKTKLQKDLFIRESLEIRYQNTGPGVGLNDDLSKYVKTHAWGPLFVKLRK
jgi:hypothetical protein